MTTFFCTFFTVLSCLGQPQPRSKSLLCFFFLGSGGWDGCVIDRNALLAPSSVVAERFPPIATAYIETDVSWYNLLTHEQLVN